MSSRQKGSWERYALWRNERFEENFGIPLTKGDQVRIRQLEKERNLEIEERQKQAMIARKKGRANEKAGEGQMVNTNTEEKT